VALKEAALPRGGFQGGVALKTTRCCGCAPLLVAIQRKQVADAEALWKLGAEVNDREPTCGWTPLMYAAGQ